MGKVQILEHPLLQHKLSILRDKNTGVKEFREAVGEIAALMCYEATRNLPTKEIEIETPVATAKVKVLAGKKLAIVPILRAGLGMVDTMISLIPSAKVGHIGLFRDPETHEPVKYYCKMPPDISERQVFIVDPMLATGGSAIAAIDILKNEYGCKSITLMDIIAAPEGVKAVSEAHPDIDIIVTAVDEKLNENAYIVGENILAVPYDVPVIGSDTTTTNTLRLWSAEASDKLPSNMEYVDYLNDVEKLCLNLYPEDYSEEGKLTRIKQEYFFVCAGLHTIIRDHLNTYGTLDNLADKVTIQLNDTHPAHENSDG